MMAVVNTDDVEAMESELLAHWANFGQIPGGRYCEADGVIWTEAPIPHLPYNAVLRSRLGGDAAVRARQTIDQFERRGVRFLWIVHPTSGPAGLEQILQDQGLTLLARETCMSLDLMTVSASTLEHSQGSISYRMVRTPAELNEYEDMITEYWSLPRDASPYVHAFSQQAFAAGDRGAWFLAYVDDQPVGKAYLSLRCQAGTASLWGVYVRPAARGFGVGSGLTRLALRHAAAAGRKRLLLVSTDMGRNVYARLGFREICHLPVYANTSSLPALQGLQPA